MDEVQDKLHHVNGTTGTTKINTNTATKDERKITALSPNTEAPASPKSPITKPLTPTGSYSSPASPVISSPTYAATSHDAKKLPASGRKSGGGSNTFGFMEQFNLQRRKEGEDVKRREIEALKKMQSYRKVIAPVRRAVPDEEVTTGGEGEDDNGESDKKKKANARAEFDSFDLDAFYLKQKKIEHLAKTKEKETIQQNQQRRVMMSPPKKLLSTKVVVGGASDGKSEEGESSKATKSKAAAVTTNFDVQDFYMQRKKSNEERRKKEMLAKKHANTRRSIRIPDNFFDEDLSESEQKDFTPVIDGRSMGLKNKSFSQRLLMDEKLKKTNLAAAFADDVEVAQSNEKGATKGSRVVSGSVSASGSAEFVSAEGSAASSPMIVANSESTGTDESAPDIRTTKGSISNRWKAKHIDNVPIHADKGGLDGAAGVGSKAKEDFVPTPAKSMPQDSKDANKDYRKHKLLSDKSDYMPVDTDIKKEESPTSAGDSNTLNGGKNDENEGLVSEGSPFACSSHPGVSQNDNITEVPLHHVEIDDLTPSSSKMISRGDGMGETIIEFHDDKLVKVAESSSIEMGFVGSDNIQDKPQKSDNLPRVKGGEGGGTIDIDTSHDSSVMHATTDEELLSVNRESNEEDEQSDDVRTNNEREDKGSGGPIHVPNGNKAKYHKSGSVNPKQSFFRSRSCKVVAILACVVAVILVVIGTTMLSDNDSTLSLVNTGTSFPTAVPSLHPTNSPSISPSSVPSLMPSTFATRYLALQREVLSTFFNTANGENWIDNDLWLSDDDETGTAVCGWFGITCTEEGFVNAIDLSENNLTGPALASELGLLGPTLTNLQLDGNAVTGSIPSEIGLLSSVTKFYMHYDALTGKLPSELGAMERLTHLIFDFNSLTGTIPSELGSLSNLKRLDLAYNFLISTIPTELGRLSNLTIVYSQNNMLTGIMPSGVCDLRQDPSDPNGGGIKVLVVDCVTEIKCDCCTFCT